MPTQLGLFRLYCHAGEKTGHIMVKIIFGRPRSLGGLQQPAIPGSAHGALGAR